jgi:aminoglycoside phosphotransferase (APT) family kinase protein
VSGAIVGDRRPPAQREAKMSGLLGKSGASGDKGMGREPGRRAGPFTEAVVTGAAVERAFAHLGLGPVHRLKRLGGGQINAAYRVNGDVVLRVRPVEKDGAAFRKEAALFARLRGRVPVPEILALEESGELLPAAFMVCRWVPGETLARVWLTASRRQRAWLLGQLAEMLRGLHEVEFPACGDLPAGELRPAESWESYLGACLQRRLGIVRALPDAPRMLLDAVDAFCRSAGGSLAAGTGRLVHRDLHFGNVLVDGDRITALLDFEAAVAAPPDYELDQLARFLRWPGMFLTDMPAVDAAAFRGVWSGLQARCPELFRVTQLETRLAVYALEYELGSLRDCLTGVWDRAVQRHVVARMEAALAKKVAPHD